MNDAIDVSSHIANCEREVSSTSVPADCPPEKGDGLQDPGHPGPSMKLQGDREVAAIMPHTCCNLLTNDLSTSLPNLVGDKPGGVTHDLCNGSLSDISDKLRHKALSLEDCGTRTTEDLAVSVNSDSKLSSVLETISLVYLPQTKQLVSREATTANGPVIPTADSNGVICPRECPEGAECVDDDQTPAPCPAPGEDSQLPSLAQPSSAHDGVGDILSQESDTSAHSSTTVITQHQVPTSEQHDAQQTPTQPHHHQQLELQPQDLGFVDLAVTTTPTQDTTNASADDTSRDTAPRAEPTVQDTEPHSSAPDPVLPPCDASSFSSISSLSTSPSVTLSEGDLEGALGDVTLGDITLGDVTLGEAPILDTDEAGFVDIDIDARSVSCELDPRPPPRQPAALDDQPANHSAALGAKPKKKGLSFLTRSIFSRKSRDTETTPLGWRLFGKVPPKEPSQELTIPGHSLTAPGHNITALGHNLTAPGHNLTAPGHNISAPGHSNLTAPGHSQHGSEHPTTIPGHAATIPGHASTVPGPTTPGPSEVKPKVSPDVRRPYEARPSTTRVKKTDVEAPSTTALILENRPLGLPSKDPEEELRHRQQYEGMVEAARKKELREAKQRKKQLQQQLKHEDALSAAVKTWNCEILPHWDSMKHSKKARELWWSGIPPAVRGRVWQLAIGNDLNLTSELYEICLSRAQDRLKIMREAASDTDSVSSLSMFADLPSSKEASVELIRLDVSRTFPQLGIFQRGGPYHELLQGLLGAYACYRPDVGYVQGMSFLAAVLLLNMDVDLAFICFANLLNRPCQIAFFRLDETLMASYFETYEAFFADNLPRLYSYFQKHKVTPNLYIIDWLFTLYAKSLPLDVASRVWDVFCRDGEEFLFRTALGILALHQEALLTMDFIHLAQFLTRLPDTISSTALFSCIHAVSMTTSADKRRFTQVLAASQERARPPATDS